MIVFIGLVLLGLAFPLVNAFFFIGFFVPDALLGSIWLIAGMALLSLACSAIIDRGKLRVLMMLALGATWLSALGWLTLIWADLEVSSLLGWIRWSTIFNCMAVAAVLIGILAQLRLSYRWGVLIRRVLYGLLVALALWGALTIAWVVEAELAWWNRSVSPVYVPYDVPEIAARISGVVAILTFCALVATIVAAALPKLHEEEVPLAQRSRFIATCPRCQTKQSLLTDGDACSLCGLRIKVVFT